jgi:hypothetical protein
MDGGRTVSILPAGRRGTICDLVGVKEADARLIVEAPELLAALRDTAEELHAAHYAAFPIPEDDCDSVACTSARAAIRKATEPTP